MSSKYHESVRGVVEGLLRAGLDNSEITIIYQPSILAALAIVEGDRVRGFR